MRSKHILYFLLFTLILGCKKSKISDISEVGRFSEYVTKYTSGIISIKSPIQIVLAKPQESWANGAELDNNLLEVSPKIKGALRATDKNTLVFTPEHPLKQNTQYTFSLDLEKIYKNDLDDFRFFVTTIKQEFSISTEPVQSHSNKLQYVHGQLRSADNLSLGTAKKLITATHNGKSIAVIFDEQPLEGTWFNFKIDNIERQDNDTKLEIAYNGKPFDIDTEGKQALNIPGKSNFSILNVIVEQSENPVVKINFSDPIKKDQNFKGLVVLPKDTDLRFSIKGNTLNVYPSKDHLGAVMLEVFSGIQSVDGKRLKKKYSEDIAFEELKPTVRVLSNGTILPTANNLKINFEAVNLSAVDVRVFRIYEDNVLQFLQINPLSGNSSLRRVARPIAQRTLELQNKLSANNGKWKAHALDLKSLITPEQGAIYSVEFSFRPQYSLYTCESTNYSATERNEDFDKEDLENSFWDYSDNYYNSGYDWNERNNPCHTSYYQNKKASTNVLASNLGVTVKKGAKNSYFVAVTNILDTRPVNGAKVTFFNYQQQPVGNTVTNAEGMAFFDSSSPAFFAVVENAAQKTYVRLNDGNALSVSKFKANGVKLQKGIKGFIFGERGVWRPGDKLFLSFMLNDNANKLPQGHPVKLELLDPYNKVVRREVKTSGINNFYHFPIQTDQDAPTGNWVAKVSVGGAQFTKTVKIETIKPNRLKIKNNFGADLLVHGEPIKGNIEVKWLHGAIAKNLNADITAKFNTKKTGFSTFPGYIFDDPSRSFSAEEQVVFDGKIDAEGKASFFTDPQLGSNPPGMLQATFVTKVYENGGDFSTDVFTKPYSPYKTYVGLNVPNGDKARGMLLTDVKHRFEVVTVDEKGKPKAAKNLKVTIHKVQWRWWWDTSEDNMSHYGSSAYRNKVFEKTISTGTNGKTSFDFELKYPDWGRYLVRVEDTKGGHATGKPVYIDWPGWAGKSNKNDPSAATMLMFSADKEKYNVGETATFTFPSSEAGRALVTIENGSEVLESFWVDAAKGDTKFTLPITTEFTPNVFVHISLLQPHSNTLNDLPIRMYGVIPISVENRETRLEPLISMPEVLRPEKTIAVKVTEKQNKPMTYSIAIVDEGLLDLTRFKTPSPWDTFYANEALGVKTWDIYDDVIGAFGGRINQVFAIGGDDDLAGAKNKKANRFEPMVIHLGPFKLKKGETKSHKIKIPKYIGSVRTMVIASDADKEAYGKAEKTTPVLKPLMILASLPRKITSGEKVTLPITVFAMEKKIKNVTVKIKEDKAFTVEGSSSKSISFTEPDEKMVYFNLDVADFKGVAKVTVEASGDGEKASFEIPIDVVNPNPITTDIQSFVLDPNGQESVDLKTFGIAGTNTAYVEFSTLPPMNFNSRMHYLIRYPHGCVEQTTSAALPQLFLSDVFDVPPKQQKQIQINVDMAIKRLAGFQLSNGGMAYWPGQGSANDWGTSYAGHFMLEAQKKGFVLPIGFRDKWIAYQKTVSKKYRNRAGNSDLAQAYRLYTLALSGNADVASMNRLQEGKNLSDEAKLRLAAAYGLIGQKSVALELMSKAPLDFGNYKYNHTTYGSASRNRAMALETIVLLNQKTKAAELAKSLSQRLNSKDYMSTQSTAYSLLAMAKFAKMIGGKGVKASVTLNGKKKSVSTEKTMAAHELAIEKGSNALLLKNNGDNTLYVSLLNDGKLPVGEEKTLQSNLNVSVVFKSRNGNTINISEIAQGTDFIAEVTLKNTSDNNIQDMALTQIFPSGWEIVNTRFTDFGNFAENKVIHTNLRDDRANFYFYMKRGEIKTFRVLLNASYLGKYYLPGVQAEAMYDNDYVVRTKGQWVEVTK